MTLTSPDTNQRREPTRRKTQPDARVEHDRREDDKTPDAGGPARTRARCKAERSIGKPRRAYSERRVQRASAGSRRYGEAQHTYARRTTAGRTTKRPTQEGRPVRGPDTKRSEVPGNPGGPTANGELDDAAGELRILSACLVHARWTVGRDPQRPGIGPIGARLSRLGWWGAWRGWLACRRRPGLGGWLGSRAPCAACVRLA